MDITPNMQQKSQLAKLMATENIIVQHIKTQTASFHPITRVLTCPIWKDMSGQLYDLLMGHEVGHALYTPADGWHSAVCDRGANYKSFLNVVEDPRIEKKIKRKYPGLRSSFLRGYNELMERDFFEIKDRDINEMPFIDRLNILTKSDYTLDITFTDYEKELVKDVQDCETWDDVLRVTEKIWNYSKDEQSQLKEIQLNVYAEFDEKQSGKNYSEDDDSDFEYDDSEDGDSDETKLGENADKDSDKESKGKRINRDKESEAAETDMEPTCETDDAFRRNEHSLLDEKSRDYVYLDIPTPFLEKIITPVKRVQEILTNNFKEQNCNYESVVDSFYQQFRKRNERYIGLLAKEFEMRKAASKYAKAKVSTTGDIDVNKVYKYQLDDSIFKKIMRVPKGKSHGLILLLDKSGSMAPNLSASLEQILILATFCRKVNIPFVVYGYGNSIHSRSADFPEDKENQECFTTNINELKFSSVYLREYLNSKMGNAEYIKSVKNILALMSTFPGNWKTNEFYRKESEALSNTPLTETLVAVKPIIEKFRAVNNLDIVNTVVIHDGDADKVDCSYSKERSSYGSVYVNGKIATYFYPNAQNVFFNDKKSKVQVRVNYDPVNGDSTRNAISEWLIKTTNTKIIGFYLAEDKHLKGAIRRRLFNDEVNTQRNQKDGITSTVVSKYLKVLRKENFLESNNSGYASFFIIPAGKMLSINDDEFEAPEKVNAANLTKAFMKYNKSRQVNRVLVNRFIGLIAT